MTMLDRLGSTPVSALETTDAVFVDESADGADAVAAMSRSGRGAALVVRDAGGRELAGIFTERDVLLLSRRGETSWRDRPVRDLMTRSPVATKSTESIGDALRKMSDGRFRRLPLLDDNDSPVGVVSVRDILAYVADYFPDEVSNLPPDPSLEAHSRYGG